MHRPELHITTNGALSFNLRDDTTRPWWWYLDLNGEPLYLIGNSCGTCEAIFRRVHDTNLPLTPTQLSTQLEAGLTSIPQALIDTIAVLLPKGHYHINLLTLMPLLVTRGSLPRGVSCEADYFWLCRLQTTDQSADYEIALPLVSKTELNPERVAFYHDRLARGYVPTALALSLYDGRAPMGSYSQTALAHFLLDGHHKMMAASQSGKALSIVSFLRINSLNDAA